VARIRRGSPQYDLTQANPSASSSDQSTAPSEVGQRWWDDSVSEQLNTAGVIRRSIIGRQMRPTPQSQPPDLRSAIPLSQLGSPTGSVKVLVDITAGTTIPFEPVSGRPSIAEQQRRQRRKSISAQPQINNFRLRSRRWKYQRSWASTGRRELSNKRQPDRRARSLNPGDSATFGPSITGPAVVSLDGARTVGQITFNSSFSYTMRARYVGSITLMTQAMRWLQPLHFSSLGSTRSVRRSCSLAGVSLIAKTTVLPGHFRRHQRHGSRSPVRRGIVSFRQQFLDGQHAGCPRGHCLAGRQHGGFTGRSKLATHDRRAARRNQYQRCRTDNRQ